MRDIPSQKISLTATVAQVPGTPLNVYTCATPEEALNWMKEQKF